MLSMRLRDMITLFWVLLLIPLALGGGYFAYQQARQRVTELNQITPLGETDLGQVVRLSLGLDDPNEIASEEIQDQNTPSVAAVPSRTPQSAAVEATPIPGDSSATAEPSIETTAEPEATAEAVEIASEPATIDPRRVTVLLMGIDQREGEEGQFRTDTMIILSLDPVGKTGAMLSIPRDLWVTIPGIRDVNGEPLNRRINSANTVGDNPELDYPGGGPALAIRTVENVTGISIDHYIVVNFDAFTTFVDSIGPIEICVKELIDDPKYPDGSYGYLPIRIEPGCQDMDATRLLQYARTRATPGGDFDRAARQQEVIMEIREKILTTGGVRALLEDSLTIWESVSENVRTDMTLDEMIALALVAQEIEDIRSDTIGAGEVLAGTAPDGSEILIPIQTDIAALVAELFTPRTVPVATAPVEVIPLDPNNVPVQVSEETPITVLMNGTNIRGRAAALQAVIQGYRLDVALVSNHTSTDITETYIVYYGDHADSAHYLAQIVATVNNGVIPRVEQGAGTRPEGDVFIIIGTDLVLPESSQ